MLVKIKNRINLIFLFSCVLETIFFFDLNNLWATLILLLVWFLLNEFVLTTRVMLRYPISFLMFFGLTLFHVILPIPLTLIELKPVTFNLLLPFDTFLHHGVFIIVLICTHILYQHLTKRRNPLRSLLCLTAFYKTPNTRVIWISSIAAFAFNFYFYVIYGGWENYGSKNLFITLGQSLSIFLWMPLIIPFGKLRGVEKRLSKRTIILIVGYSLLVIIISVISNWRTMLFSGIVIFLALYLLGILYGQYKISKIFSPTKLVAFGIAIYLFTGPIMDLGLAMVITRQTRYTTDSKQFLNNTIDVYKDKDELNAYREIATLSTKNVRTKRWDENYLDNYFFNRLCNLKISDNCIYYANKLGYAHPKMQAVLADQITSYVPGFLSKRLGIQSETRNEEFQSSIADNLYSLAIHDPTVKGSAVIGSMPGVGLSIFGYWYLLVIIPIFLIIFTMFDSFVNISKGRIDYSYYFYPLILICFNFFNDRHVFNFELRWILRNYVESVILFLILFTALRKIDSILKSRFNEG